MIVSDTTTLIILSDLKRFDLLSNLFQKIYVPKRVFEELNYKSKIKLPDFFEIVEVNQNYETLKYLKLILDEGESEAIVYAKENNLPLIIDEKKGRKVAKDLNLKIIGLLGILYLNYKRKFINKKEIEEFLNSAIENGYRVSEKLINDFFENINN